VKTSSQAVAPPSVVYGEGGLRGQVEEMRDVPRVARNLVKWLGTRSKGQDWEDSYKAAGRAFLANDRDIAVSGVLVRDVAPDPDDLAGMASALAPETQDPIMIELHALYLPDGAPPTLAGRE
jgi:hypothetical protein